MSSGFFEEVKRRKVYRVAAAYVIAAGGVIQLASAAFPAWELPNWALRLVIALLLLGFPIALVACLGVRHHSRRVFAQHHRRQCPDRIVAGISSCWWRPA